MCDKLKLKLAYLYIYIYIYINYLHTHKKKKKKKMVKKQKGFFFGAFSPNKLQNGFFFFFNFNSSMDYHNPLPPCGK